ncbi:MAG: LysR substrate-binding domain-containing protein [Oceanospirillaceae bacterium]
MLNSKQLATFKAVMLTGSMSDASRILHVSQPAVSRMIKDLESELGFTLFDRRNSRIYPTQAAHAFYREVQLHLVGLTKLSQAAEQIRIMKRGKLRIASMPALAFSTIPVVLSNFLKVREEVSAIFSPHLSVELVNRVGAQQFDLGITMLPIESKEIMYGPCYKVDCRCIAPADHPFKDYDVVTAADLHQQPYISIGEQNTIIHFLLNSALKEANAQPIERVETLLLPMAASLVEQGLGVSVVDAFTAHAFEKKGVISRPFEPSISLYFGFIAPVNRPISGLAQEFIDVFEEFALEHYSLTSVLPSEAAIG